MKIAGKIADTRAVAVWKASLGSVADSQIIQFVTLNPQLSAGFRPGKISPALALQRTQAMLDQAVEMPQILKELLSDAGLNQSLLKVLSDEAISAAEPHLCDLFGHEEVWAAMLISERDSVREMGEAGFAKAEHIETSAEQRKAAGELLNQLFLPFLKVLGAHPVSVVENKRETMTSVKSVDETSRSKAEAELTEARREARRVAKEFEKTSAELKKLQHQIKQLEVNLQANKVELASEKSSHRTLLESYEQQVNEEAQRRVDRRLFPWLESAESMQAALDPKEGTAIETARAVLQQQEQTDRRYGLWSRLSRERDECMALVDHLDAAKLESVRPLTQLDSAKQMLMERIEDLEKLLNAQNSSALSRSVAQQISLRLRSTHTLEDLILVRQDLESSYRLGLLRHDGLTESYRLVNQACWQLYAANETKAHQGDNNEMYAGLPMHVLQTNLEAGKPCMLLIDGHNALFRLKEAQQLQFEGDVAGPKARRALADQFYKIASAFPACEIHLWFDGEDAREISMAANFTVHYSGGQGANRADGQIVKYLESMKYVSGHNKASLKALVTADRAFSREAATTGHVVILAPEELAILVAHWA
jgi:hypothetical protein